MEFAKTSRKFEKMKIGKKKKGRPAMGQLKLSMPDNAEKQLDLSKIARSVATTRIGQRLHQQVANNIAQKKAKDSLGKKVRFCLSIFCFTFTCFFLFFVCFFVNLIFCIINYFFMLFD